MSTLNRLLRSAAEERPDQRALIFLRDGEDDVVSITFGELHARACAVARLLGQRSAGERVLLLHPPGIDFVAALFGTLYAGHVAVPAHPPSIDRSFRRLEAIAADSDPAFVLTTSAIVEARSRVAAALPALEKVEWASTDSLSPEGDAWWSPGRGEELAVLQYTSGSTGTPKGVMCTHENVLHNAAYVKKAYRVTDDSVSVTWLPHFHDMGLMLGLMQPLYSRIPGVLVPSAAFVQKPLRLLRAISRYRGSHAGGPNFCFDLCVRRVSPEERDTLDLTSWVCAYNGAEPVRRATLERFSEYFAPAGFRARAHFPALGMAEHTAHVCGGSVDAAPVFLDHLVGCGRAGSETTIVIVDPATMTACADRSVGEIWVKGPSVARGYWRRDADTERTFRARLDGEGPFLRTGDLGFVDDGEVFVTGRLKDVIIVRGANHYPQDIELTVETSHPALRPGYAAAFGVDVEAVEQVVVVVETSRAHLKAPEREQIFDAVRRRVVEEHELELHAICILERGSILKTSSGKIERRASKAAFVEGTLRVVAEWRARSRGGSTPVTPPPELSARAVEVWLAARIAARLGVDAAEIDLGKTFAAYGLASADAVELSGRLEEWSKRAVSPTLFYEHPNIQRVARHLVGGDAVRSARGPATSADAEPIAVIGFSCRLPGGVFDAESFWSLLSTGVDAITEVPVERWRADGMFGGFLPDVDRFDAGFFEIAPREARSMDPQQRLLLELTYEALEDAGAVPETLAGSATGVFVGLCNGDYQHLLRARAAEEIDAYMNTGTSFAVAGGRISYAFGFEGPNVAIDTACSASLVAVHLACQSLRGGESNLAIAGGVNVILSPEVSLNFSRANMLAPDGRCKAFDAAADGYVRSEGGGLVVLKRLSHALRDGDRILGVIRGSAINQDGRSNGLTAPNGGAQERVIRQALAAAQVAAADVGYVEAHGTGTPLGDPIELGALKQVYGAGEGICAVGSLKTNVGHLESAAGIAGLLKVLLAFERERIPPQLHFRRLNPRVSLEGSRLRIAAEAVPWKRGAGPRIAGVSSFGLSGTNAHVVVEEPPATPDRAPARRPRVKVLPVSARHVASLRAQAVRLAEQIEVRGDDPVWLADAVATAAAHRTHHPLRLCAVGETPAELAQGLRAAAAVEEAPSLGRVARRPIVFVYSGQGSQWANMGRRLLAEEPAFAGSLREADAALGGHTGFSVLELLEASSEDARLRNVAVIQPMIFAIQVALTAQWRAWGVTPDAVLGHSLGEVAASVAAGALSLDDGAKVIALRSRLVQPTTGRGRMALVELSAAAAERELHGWPDVAIASYHGPDTVLVSGGTEAVEGFVRTLDGRGVFARLVDVDYASHSAQMDPILDELARALEGVRGRSLADVALCSTLFGELIRGEELNATYWVRNLREPVRFHQGVEKLLSLGHELFVEVSPHPVLVPTLERTLGKRGAALGSLRRERDDVLELSESLARLYTLGGAIEWSKRAEGGRVVRLPRYAWQSQRYWIEAPPRSRSATSGHAWLDSVQASALEPGSRVWQGEVGTERLPDLGAHQIDGDAVVPGALWLEVALHVARVANKPACLVDVTFTHLLAPGAATTVQVIARDSGFEVLSASGDGTVWTRHAEGRWAETSAAPAVLPGSELARAREACKTSVSASELYDRLRGWGIEHGARYAGVENVWVGADEAVAQLVVGEREAGRWEIEPWILDAATHVLALADEQRMLPAGVGRLVLYGRPGAKSWVHAAWRRVGAEIEGRIRLYDVAGTVRLDLEGVRLRPSPRKRSSPKAFEIAWERKERASLHAPDGTWLVVSDGAVGAAAGARLEALGARVVRVGLADEPARALASLGQCSGVVCVFAEEHGELVANAAERCALVAHAVVRSLAASEKPPRLWFVTHGLADSSAWGLARTVAHEHPECWPTCVEVPERVDAKVLDALIAELGERGAEHEVALRSEGRFVARLAPRELEPSGDWIPATPDGAYLVTGGLGGLGLEVARALADGGARRLVLVGRSAPGSEAKTAIEALSERGVEMRVERCDVSLPSEVRRLVASIPLLKGVVHAAGVLRDATILRAAPSSFEQVFAPKVRGAWNLHEATRDLALDFFVLFSSAASVLGSAGQGNYSAANAFLGALARHRRNEGLAALSVAFGTFSDRGLAAARADRGERLAKTGYLGLTAKEGISIVAALLKSGATDVVALRLDAKRWTESHPSLAELPFFAPLADKALLRSGDCAHVRHGLLEVDPRHRLGRLEAFLCGELARVLRQDASVVRPWTPFGALGLDSVMALEMRNRLENALDLRLPASIMWTHRTIEALAIHLADAIGLSRGVDPANDGKAEAEAEALHAQPDPYADLSDEQATSALLATLDALDEKPR